MPTGFSPSMTQLSRCFSLMNTSKCSPTTPVQHATQVWALPFSLATTLGIIIIFFSSGYLDVSVLRVGFPCGILYLQYSELSHSEIPGYNARVQLSQAYRSLPRPSSPLRPKASTIRPYVALKKFEIVEHDVLPPRSYLLLNFYNSLSQYVKELQPGFAARLL